MTVLDKRFGSADAGAASATPASTASPPDDERRPAGARRRLLWAALAVLALAGAVAAGRAWEAHGRTAAWILTRDVAPGTQLTAADVRPIHIEQAPADALTAGASPAGSVATASLRAGAVLRTSDVSSSAVPVPGAGEALVGLAAVPGRVPDGLRTGDRVRVVALPAEPPPGRAPGAPRILLTSVVVQRVVGTPQGTTVTLVVPLKVAPTAAALAAANRIALVGLSR